MTTVVIVAFLAVAFCGCAVLFPSGRHQDFIKVHGTHFTEGGRPYYFAGMNLWYGCYLGSPGATGDRPRLLRELDTLCAHGLTNLRVLGASEGSHIKRTIDPAIQTSAGVVDDSLLEGLDFLLAEMAKRDMRAVIFLNNYWEWSGGMAQYNAWTRVGNEVDPEDPAQGYGAFMRFSAQFYSNQEGNALYRTYIRQLVNRTNTVTGRCYRDDPTIMTWELANEPRPGTDGPDGEQNLEAFYRWIDETARYIHGLDANHLVTTGSEGAVAFRWRTDVFLKAHQPVSIDYLTFHLWPKNWGWFDPLRHDSTVAAAETKALGYMADHIKVAETLNKPLVLEEFGLARDNAGCRPGSPVTARNRYFAKLLAAVADSARQGGPVSGTNIWTWGGDVSRSGEDTMWHKGDPFMGDPPQEPQGYNAVFTADKETMQILHAHAAAMNSLNTTH